MNKFDLYLKANFTCKAEDCEFRGDKEVCHYGIVDAIDSVDCEISENGDIGKICRRLEIHGKCMRYKKAGSTKFAIVSEGCDNKAKLVCLNTECIFRDVKRVSGCGFRFRELLATEYLKTHFTDNCVEYTCMKFSRRGERK